jgi:hypothetical protein
LSINRRSSLLWLKGFIFLMSSSAKTNGNDDDLSDEQEQRPQKKQKQSKYNSMIDDAAEESGDEGNDDDDEEDDEENENNYQIDGFVVDEADEEKQADDDLEDSDNEDSDDDHEKQQHSRLKKVRKMKQRLDDEDLALIQEAQAEQNSNNNNEQQQQQQHARVVAKTEAELRKGLFYDSDEGDLQQQPSRQQQDPQKVVARERYDEDGMDDFIDDDIGDQGDIMASERRGDEQANDDVNEAQLIEASEIFGTDYLEFMQQDDDDDDEQELLGYNKSRDKRGGVVDLEGDSDMDMAESDDDDDEDLFDDDDDEDGLGMTSAQKAEALKLKREKRKLQKGERRQAALKKQADRRKAHLRRAFEPVQLVENFCTERDDEIRLKDVPERLFDWHTPFYGSTDKVVTEAECEQARWIAQRIPRVAAEYNAGQQATIVQSIAHALKFMHRDNLEAAFIKRYRRDYVSSPVVLDHLHDVMDQDAEYDRMQNARQKVDALVMEITSASQMNESVGADAHQISKLHEELEIAQSRLDETAKQESLVKAELEALGNVQDDEDDDDDDDELFGDSGEKAEVRSDAPQRSVHLTTFFF